MRLLAGFSVSGSTRIALALFASRTYVVFNGGPPDGVGEFWARAAIDAKAVARIRAPRVFFTFRSFAGKAHEGHRHMRISSAIQGVIGAPDVPIDTDLIGARFYL